MLLPEFEMTDSSLDLFTDHPESEDATLEELASYYEITVDYLLAEFL